MITKAQGFIEVTSLIPAIEAADAMAKAADVVIHTLYKVDGPAMCVICEGDVAACEAAVDAGKAVCMAKGTFVVANVIARPEQSAEQFYASMQAMQARKAAKKAERLARREAVFAKLAEEEERSVPLEPPPGLRVWRTGGAAATAGGEEAE